MSRCSTEGKCANPDGNADGGAIFPECTHGLSRCLELRLGDSPKSFCDSLATENSDVRGAPPLNHGDVLGLSEAEGQKVGGSFGALQLSR